MPRAAGPRAASSDRARRARRAPGRGGQGVDRATRRACVGGRALPQPFEQRAEAHVGAGERTRLASITVICAPARLRCWWRVRRAERLPQARRRAASAALHLVRHRAQGSDRGARRGISARGACASARGEPEKAARTPAPRPRYMRARRVHPRCALHPWRMRSSRGELSVGVLDRAHRALVGARALGHSREEIVAAASRARAGSRPGCAPSAARDRRPRALREGGRKIASRRESSAARSRSRRQRVHA